MTITQNVNHFRHLCAGNDLIRLERAVLVTLDDVQLLHSGEHIIVHLNVALVSKRGTGKRSCCAGCRHAQRDQSLSECHINFLLLLHGHRSTSIGGI